MADAQLCPQTLVTVQPRTCAVAHAQSSLQSSALQGGSPSVKGSGGNYALVQLCLGLFRGGTCKSQQTTHLPNFPPFQLTLNLYIQAVRMMMVEQSIMNDSNRASASAQREQPVCVLMHGPCDMLHTRKRLCSFPCLIHFILLSAQGVMQ
jgi:hypothetical protein